MMAPAASRLTEPAWSPLSPPNFESSAFTASRTSIAALSRRLCASGEGCRHPSPHSSERLGPWWSGVVQEVENHSHALADGRDVVRPVSVAGGIRAALVEDDRRATARLADAKHLERALRWLDDVAVPCGPEPELMEPVAVQQVAPAVLHVTAPRHARSIGFGSCPVQTGYQSPPAPPAACRPG